MSVRIYQLSKQLGIENKELILILKDRGLKVDSPSNTIPNIYADALIEEHKRKNNGNEEAQSTVVEKAPSVEVPQSKIMIEAVAIASDKSEGVVVSAMTDTVEKPELVEMVTPVMNEVPVIVENLPQTPSVKAAPTVPGMRSLSAPNLPPRPPAIPKKPNISYQPVEVKSFEEPEVVVSEAAAPVNVNRMPSVPNLNKAPSLGLAPRLAGRVGVNKVEEEPGVEKALKKVVSKPPFVVRDFAVLLDIKPFRLISELMEMGIFASMNQPIEEDVAVRVAKRHGILLEVRHRGETQVQQVAKKQEPVVKSVVLEPRAPVVCVLGHVDHGKTTLLDTIRRTNVVKGEAGGITQHIGAYQVEHKNHKITFIDTPGHAAFSKMRERGASVTDIAVLVVAADDGFMPQTDEALKFAQKAGVPVVVAINKVDAKGANIDRVKQQLQQRGITSEDWGGETLVAPVSALKGDGMPDLLDSILLQAEMMELKADFKGEPEATIVESQMEQGLGSTASVIVKQGVLKAGMTLVCGASYCRIRSMMDDKGKALKEAVPSTPVKLIGWNTAPQAGLIAKLVKNEKEAKLHIDDFLESEKVKAQQEAAPKAPMDIHQLFASLSDQKKLLKVLIKADVHGSVEALTASLLAIKSTKVSLEVIEGSVGLVSKNDVMLAATSGAVIVAFNTKLDTGVAGVLKHEGVQMIQHNIIYELIDQVRDAMADLLDPELKEVKVGAAEVRQLFELSKGNVAGCMVIEGKVNRDAQARLVRKGKVIHQGKIVTLKRFKDDATEVRAGYECGIRIDGFDAYEPKDIIETVSIETMKAAL